MDYLSIRNDNIDPDVLAHYGVKGMKWGVRRNLRVLSNNRRNSEIRDAKRDYRQGKITSAQKKAAIRQATKNRDQVYKDMKSSLKNASSRAERKAKINELKNTTIKEVPHSKLKKGLNMVRHLLTTTSVAGSTAAGVGSAGAALGAAASVGLAGAALPFAGAALGSAAVSSAAALGLSYLGGKVMDRLS